MVDSIQPNDFASHHQPQNSPRRFNLLCWFKHACYIPWRTRHYFNAQAREQIHQAVTQAEFGHAGEIQVIIEGHLPLDLALRGDTALRARQLFAQYGVWDTAYNSGVLLYINLCARQVEILADRGIHQFVNDEHWQAICQQVTSLLAHGHYADGVLAGVQQIGATLEQFYDQKVQDLGNELGDGAVFL
ncbi:TPM domain-containing protein [Alkanindiges sp. WGS2144]|uniref:TPM domain-containing protein n=1 Tax=Alkanindiges sp. WGS2144 TaxID=3366808 RepID=UPI0037528412